MQVWREAWKSQADEKLTDGLISKVFPANSHRPGCDVAYDLYEQERAAAALATLKINRRWTQGVDRPSPLAHARASKPPHEQA